MQPSASFNIQDGALGIIPGGKGDAIAIMGPCTDGPIATPIAFGRGSDVATNFGGGPTVEAAAFIIKTTGRPILFCRVEGSTDSDTTTIDNTGFAGTAKPAINTNTDPDDNYEVWIDFPVGGTPGTAGIKYRTSLNGGRTKTGKIALGTGTSITVPTAAGLVKVDIEPPLAELVALANDARTQFLAHIIDVTGSIHLHADSTSDDGVPAAATTRAEVIALANALRTGYEAHRIKVGAGGSQVHLAADTTNTITAPASTNLVEARTLLNQFQTVFAAHEADTDAHTIADATNVITATAASPGTVVAGDVLTFRASAANWTTDDLVAGQTALQMTKQPWDVVLIVGDTAAAGVTQVDAWLESLKSKTKFKRANMNARLPTIGESEATYQTAMGTDFGAVSSLWIDLSAGGAKTDSAITGRDYRRPPSWSAAARQILIANGRDPSEKQLGALPGVRIVDDNGNPDDHDETNYPGLDDLGFTVLRTFEGEKGVYLNNDRMFAPEGSDFIFVQYRRVMNAACKALAKWQTDHLSMELVVDESGFLAASSVRELNEGGTKAMADAVLATGDASAVQYVVSTTANVLSTETVPGQARVRPKGYAKFFTTDIGFDNPALRVANSAA